MYMPHHTISHTHTHTPQEKKTSKNRRKFLACRQTLVYITRTPASTSRHTPSVEKNMQSYVDAYFPFLLPLHVLFSIHWLERTRHHPASVMMISSHSASLHHFILNKTSYATKYFVCPHQLRFYNSQSNSPTSYFMPMGGRRIAVPQT